LICKVFDDVIADTPEQENIFLCEWDEIRIYLEPLKKEGGRNLASVDRIWRVRYQEWNKGFWCVKHYPDKKRAMRGVKEVQYWQRFLEAEEKD
jgi:hypothetical protein